MTKITSESKDERNTITTATGFKTCPVLLQRIHEETELGAVADKQFSGQGKIWTNP